MSGPERSSPTLADVARRAGVSLATASRALNGGNRVVGAQLRDRVLTAARDLSYIPNAHAQALASANTATVGVIVHDVSDPYFAAIAKGVLQVATEHDLLVMICQAHRSLERELAYVATLRAQRVKAILLAGSGSENGRYSSRMSAELTAYTAAGGRVACISRHHLPVDAVLPDNRGGGEDMGRALLELGHRVFAVITGPGQLTTVRDRFAGFERALADSGVALPAERVVAADFTRDGGYRAGLELIDRSAGVTAVFALNDLMAVGVLAALRERGVAVPDDVSVAGFDDIQMVRDMTPPLSTVRIPMADMGARGLRLALRPQPAQLAREHVAAEVVLRASTAVVHAPHRAGRPRRREP